MTAWIQNNYEWEAETFDHEVFNQKNTQKDHPCFKGDLTDIARYSLRPKVSGLPPFDIVNVRMERRFQKGFNSFRINDSINLQGLFFWTNNSPNLPTSHDLTSSLKPGDLIGKGVDGDGWYKVHQIVPFMIHLDRPYAGISKPEGWRCKKILHPYENSFKYFHVIVCDTFRIYINYETGAVMMTPKDYDLFI